MVYCSQCPPPPPPLPFKLSDMVTFLTRSWNMTSTAPKNTRARYSSGIESKHKFEYEHALRSDLRAPNYIKKNFCGNMPLDPPSMCMLMHAPSLVPPQILSTFRWLWFITRRLVCRHTCLFTGLNMFQRR